MKHTGLQPMATFRLQFNKDFRLEDARDLVPWFSRLGVTHLYASPILRAREGSEHGYDVTDPRTLNPVLGTETDLSNLSTQLKRYGMGLILDIVPNHMAACFESPAWRDVLTYGPVSPYASWFDVDWRLPDPEMWGRVLLPVLGGSLKEVLDKEEILLAWEDGRFRIQYFDNIFPLNPATVPEIFEPVIRTFNQKPAGSESIHDRVVWILEKLRGLPGVRTRVPNWKAIDRDEVEEWLGQLAQLVVQSPQLQKGIVRATREFSRGSQGIERLRHLLNRQVYRLVYWRQAARTINYRRFFDINELVSLRQEDPQVFQETHSTILHWIELGLVDGLRIDHVDGLRDPGKYLKELRKAIGRTGRKKQEIPIFVEKILAPDESLRRDWPVTGTTGYEFLNQVEALFVSREGFREIKNQYSRLTHSRESFHQFARQGKRQILRGALSAPVGRLADLCESIVRQSGDATLTNVPSRRELISAIVETIAALPIYRTYVDGVPRPLSKDDCRYLAGALREVRQRKAVSEVAVDRLQEILLLCKEPLPERERLNHSVHFIQRFQQVSSPAAAKGIEDTALYAYVPLVSLNEVGGEPVLSEDPCADFLIAAKARAAAWPHGMLAVTTHDTKRSADVRARLDVLSEMAGDWFQLVRQWNLRHRRHKSIVKGKHFPDPAAEYLFYQSLIGIWPAPEEERSLRLPNADTLKALRKRLESYMIKAVREAKMHTSWTRTEDRYEQALLRFIGTLMGGEETEFLNDVTKLLARIARPGFWNSLARTVIQFTSPGTPDLYQGDDLWNFALVDPDNRRPVDYQERRRQLDEIVRQRSSDETQAFIEDLIAHPENGRIKMFVIHTLLRLRREHPRLFTAPACEPLDISGPSQGQLFGFMRISGKRRMVVLVPRLTLEWANNLTHPSIEARAWQPEDRIRLPTASSGHRWHSVFTGEPLKFPPGSQSPWLPITAVLKRFPVAVLEN